jgi:hypothetical protein
MDPMRHEVWCSPDHCTVVDDVPADGGEHRSKPIPLDMRRTLGPRQVTVQLTRMQQMWPTDPYLLLNVDGVEVWMPADTAEQSLTVVNRLLRRRVTPSILENERAAETARRYGYPASAEDDYCPLDEIEYGTHWLGADDFGNNWWVHESGPEACGHRWSNPVRRPHNGVPIVLVTPVETICFYCDEVRQHATPAWSAAYGAAHTAMHEAEVTP